jgi:hypothetical protein
VDANCRTPVPVEDPITAQIARDNIVKAVKKRGFDGPNLIPNYDISLAPLFLYVPDADALQAASGRSCAGAPFFDNWGHEREVRFMQLVLEEASTLPDTVDLEILRWELDARPNPDQERYRIDYVFSLRFAARDSTPRECYAATALWTFSGASRSHFLLEKWEDTASLLDTRCAGGATQGSIGILKVLQGDCASAIAPRKALPALPREAEPATRRTAVESAPGGSFPLGRVVY